MTRIAARLFAAALLAAPLPARADVIFYAANFPFTGESVLPVVGGTGTTIFGTTSPSGTTVAFTSLNGSTLVAPATGSPRVTGMGAGGFAISLPGSTFTAFAFDLDAVADGEVRVSVLESDGRTSVQAFAVAGSGSNYVTVLAVNGPSIGSVSVLPGADLASVRAMRVGGVGGVATVVPEPGAVALLATGLAMLTLAARRRA